MEEGCWCDLVTERGSTLSRPGSDGALGGSRCNRHSSGIAEAHEHPAGAIGLVALQARPTPVSRHGSGNRRLPLARFTRSRNAAKPMTLARASRKYRSSNSLRFIGQDDTSGCGAEAMPQCGDLRSAMKSRLTHRPGPASLARGLDGQLRPPMGDVKGQTGDAKWQSLENTHCPLDSEPQTELANESSHHPVPRTPGKNSRLCPRHTRS